MSILNGWEYILVPKGVVASEELNILLISFLLMLVVVIPVIIISFVFAYKYRESNANANYQPEWAHSVKLEVIWWLIPCIIIAILSVITFRTSHSLDPFKPIVMNDKKPITIQVLALQWKWLFIYPEQNIATVNYVQFPANTPVKFEITSNGPMNSFLIPELGGQIYAMAGMKTQIHLVADSPGKYSGFSSNFSGDGFADMNFVAHATTQEEFDSWVKTVKLSQRALTLESYNELAAPSIGTPAQYSSINKNIFKFVVMKNMMPEKEILYLCREEVINDTAKLVIR